MAAIKNSQSRLLAAEFKHKLWMGHSSFALQVGLSIPLPRTTSGTFPHKYRIWCKTEGIRDCDLSGQLECSNLLPKKAFVRT